MADMEKIKGKESDLTRAELIAHLNKAGREWHSEWRTAKNTGGQFEAFYIDGELAGKWMPSHHYAKLCNEFRQLAHK